MIQRSLRILSLALAGVWAIGFGPAGAAPEPLRFGPTVRISPEMSEAWEPVLLTDRFGNIFMHARKATTNLVLALDDRSPTGTRSMSWLWMSADGGATFTGLPGLPLSLENHTWGYEGDFALDGAGRLYFVDQTYADSTITRWTVTGRGALTFDFHRPFLPTGQPIEDRPWLAAQGDGSLIYIVNAGDSNLNPVGSRDGGDAFGQGRFSLYRSADGGQTFDVRGRALNESGACRPAADRRAGSRLMVVVCTNDGGAQDLDEVPQGRGTLFAYVSEDAGATFSRYRIGDYNADAETFDWPLVTVAPNGDVYAVHHNAAEVRQDGEEFQIVRNALNLFRSTDRGRTWSKQDITPRPGRYRWSWLTASPRGELGLVVQHRPNENAPWRVYASVFAPGTKPALVSVDEAHPISGAANPQPPSEMSGITFLPDGTVAVAWTRVEASNGLSMRRVYFSRSVPSQRQAPTRVKGARRTLPATGVSVPLVPALGALTASLALAVRLRRR